MPPSPARSSKTTGPLREGLSARTRGLPSSSRRHDFARLWNQMASRVGSNNLVPRPRGRRQSRRLPHGRARSLSRQSKTTRNEKTFPPQLASNARSSRAEGFQYTRDFDFWHYSDRLLAVRACGGGAALSPGFFRKPFPDAEELDAARGSADGDADGERPRLDEEGAVAFVSLRAISAGDVELPARGLEILEIDDLAREPDAGRRLDAFELQDPLCPAGKLRPEKRVERPRVAAGHGGLRRAPVMDPPSRDVEPAPPVALVVRRARRDDVGQCDLASRDLHVVVLDVPARDPEAAGRPAAHRPVRVAKVGASEREVPGAPCDSVIEPNVAMRLPAPAGEPRLRVPKIVVQEADVVQTPLDADVS